MDAKLRQRIIWGLRRMSYKLGWRAQVLRRARLPYGSEVCTDCGIQRRKVTFRCADCKQAFCGKCVDADHIKPVVAGGKFTTWDDFINGMFTDPNENGQVLCKADHKKKSALEASDRAATRKKEKNPGAEGSEQTLHESPPRKRRVSKPRGSKKAGV